MGIVDRYNKYIKKFRVPILVFWIIILVLGITYGFNFFDKTENVFEPPEYTDGYKAQQVLEQVFPERANSTSLIIIIKSNNNNSVLNPEVQDYTFALIEKLNNFENSQIIKGIYSYYGLQAINQSDVAKSFVSENLTSTLIIVIYETENKDVEEDFIEYVEDTAFEIHLNEEEYSVYLTGLAVMDRDFSTAIVDNLKRMDTFILPIALIVLAIVIRRLKLMILPLISIAISIFTTFLILYGFTYIYTILSFAPSIVMSLVIAISIDYSLFLLTRYREEVEKGKDNFTAVSLMNEHSGHTILVSGLTLAVCFLGLMFFPVNAIASLGLSAGITVVVTLVTNLTFTPAALLTFGKFFYNEKYIKKIEQKLEKIKNNGKNKKIKENIKDARKKLNWVTITKFSQKYAVPIILLILVIAVPISVNVMKMELSLENKHLLPRNSQTWDAYAILEEDFNAGQLLPYYLIIQTNETNGVRNPTFFENSQKIIANLSLETKLTNESITGISWLNGQAIPWFYASILLNPSSSDSNSDLYKQMWTNYATSDNSSALFEIITPFDPQGKEALDWVKHTRKLLKDFEKEFGYEIYLAGGAIFWIDSLEVTTNLFPYMILTVILIVYVLIVIMFGSFFIPLRLLITIGLTLSWIFGLAVLVFEQNVLDWLFPNVLRGVNSLYWIVPIITFSIVLGLGLDYDIFLLSRISEYRKKGYSDRSAIIKGVEKTGTIITAAGIIMAIAFSGLLISSEMILNQVGFILCISVLVDTFFIRTILVPAIMSLAQKWNWWPKKMPEVSKEEIN
ncbi:MAG: MMPL family transporter [Candidatus Heimdallarchaeaceae archaeon]